MGLRIFETDPEAAPRQRFADEMVGRFRSGYQINKRPATLEAWRITTGDPEVANRVHVLFGGEPPQEWDATGEDNLEVFTTTAKVKIILDGGEAIRQQMVLWGRAGAIRRCDGVQQHGDDAAGKGCECPAAFADRKEAAKKGTGCTPSITIFFKLADDPELGKFKFNTGSWSLVKEIGQAETQLAAIGGAATAWLKLEPVEYESDGKRRTFVKPVLEVIGPAPPETG